MVATIELPHQVDAISTVETRIVLANVTLFPAPLSVAGLNTSGPAGRHYGLIGSVANGIWSYTPNDTDAAYGAVPFEVLLAPPTTIFSVSKKGSRFFVNPQNIPAVARSICLIGSSLTASAGCVYPNRVNSRLVTAGITPTFLGAMTPAGADAGVKVQSESGRSWRYYASDPTSPFYPNMATFFTTTLGGTIPDVIVFGESAINDILFANIDFAESFAANALHYLTRLVASARAAAPSSKLIVTGLPASNDLASSATLNYGAAVTKESYRYVRQVYNTAMHERFGDREHEGIHVAATDLPIDPVADFPVDNFIHYSAPGHQRYGDAVAATIYSAVN